MVDTSRNTSNPTHENLLFTYQSIEFVSINKGVSAFIELKKQNIELKRQIDVLKKPEKDIHEIARCFYEKYPNRCTLILAGAIILLLPILPLALMVCGIMALSRKILKN